MDQSEKTELLGKQWGWQQPGETPAHTAAFQQPECRWGQS